jgi:DNA recombination protein RmuC
VAYGWKQEQIAKSAQEISEVGKTLYDRLRVVAEHFEGLRQSLDKSVEAYNRIARSFETRVMVTARKFKELGITTSEESFPLDIVDKVTCSLNLEPADK